MKISLIFLDIVMKKIFKINISNVSFLQVDSYKIIMLENHKTYHFCFLLNQASSHSFILLFYWHKMFYLNTASGNYSWNKTTWSPLKHGKKIWWISCNASCEQRSEWEISRKLLEKEKNYSKRKNTH